LITRRQFSKSLGAASATLLSSGRLSSGAAPLLPPPQNAARRYDLLIKGGTVIDPGQNLHSALDVAVKDGKVLDLSADIPASEAGRVFSAKGKLVTPGLVDVHTHIYEGVGPLGVNADHYCLGRGVTTAVDDGSAGYVTIAGLRKYVINTSATRLYASMDSGAIGLATLKEDLEWVNPELAAQAALDNKPDVVAITARLSKADAGRNDLEILKRARQATDAAKLPLMVHAQGTYSPLPEYLKIMRKGDVLTHCFHDLPYGVLDGNGKLLPEVRDARARGILFSVGHGSHFSFDVAEKCTQQDFLPDAISSDIEAFNVGGPVFDLPTTLNKYLLFGLGVDKVIELATIKPAHVFDFGLELGTLQPGSIADIAIMELREGSFTFMDGGKHVRTGRQALYPAATVRGGQMYVNRSEDLSNA
jgi:dihydroorotase